MKEPAAAAEGIGRVWRFDSKETDKALAYSVKLAETGLKLENGWFEFTYWLPEDSKVVKLRPGVRVREGERKGKLIAADVTPVKGMWTTRPLAARRRLFGGRAAGRGEHADSLELGVLASGGPIVLEIGRLAAGVSAPPASGGAAAADADNIYSAALAPGGARRLECGGGAARLRRSLGSRPGDARKDEAPSRLRRRWGIRNRCSGSKRKPMRWR